MTVRKETNRKAIYHKMRAKGSYGGDSENDSSSDSDASTSSLDGAYRMKVRVKTSHKKKDDDDSTAALRT